MAGQWREIAQQPDFIHLEINQGLFIGEEEPSIVWNANRCPDGGALLLICRWLVKAHCVLQL